MAVVSEGFEITLTVADTGDNRSTLTYPCDPAVVVDYAEAVLAKTALIAAYEGVSDAEIVGATIKEVYYENAIVLPASAQVEMKASITLQIFGQNKKANIKIPAPKATLFNGASGAAFNQIDVTDPALIIYVGKYWTGTGLFYISDGEKVATASPANGIVVGKRINAKNNNG